MFRIICFMAEQIPVGSGVIKLLVTVIRTLAYRQSDGTIGEMCPDLRDDITESLVGKPSVLPALKDKCPEAEPVAFFAAGKNVLFCETVPYGI